MTRIRTAGFGIVALLVGGLPLLSACGGGDDDSEATPTAAVGASTDPSDCGHVGEINSPNQIGEPTLV